MSEDTPSAVRAMQIRRRLDQIPSQLSNAKTVHSELRAAETSLMQISSINQSVHSRFIQAMNGDISVADRPALISDLHQMREQMLTMANSEFAGRFLFGGTNTITRPFELVRVIEGGVPMTDVNGTSLVDADGNLLPPVNGTAPGNGVLIRGASGDMYALQYNGRWIHDMSDADRELLTRGDTSFVDIGLSMRFNDTNIIQNSAFRNSLSGLDFMGTGDNNLIHLITDMINHIEAGFPDRNESGALLDRFLGASSTANLMLTEIGALTNHLDFSIARLEDERDNLIRRQDDLEFIPREEAILMFKMQEFVYNATLQMGQRLLQPSLFNFIN